MKNRPKLTLSSLLALVIAALIMAYGEGEEKGSSNAEQAFKSRFSKKSAAGAQKAGDFDYYALVMSWSPTHCATPEGARDRMQCNRRDGRRYAFILHGLWPQYHKGYPEKCRTAGRLWVPEPVMQNMLDIMPSRGLIKHEYVKHGTCSGLSAKAYYELSRKLFQSVSIPSRFKNPLETQFISPADLVDSFVAVNPQLKRNMLAVSCRRGPGKRLREIRVCFTRDGQPRACGKNENQRRLCRADRMHVPPVRSSR